MKIVITKNARILALFAIGCTAVVGIVNLLTKDTIALQQRKALLSSLNTIISPARYDNNLFEDCTLITDINGNEQKVYLARLQGEPVAAAYTATAPDGYSGNINMIVGVNLDNSVSAVRVLAHKETPGLGDKIEVRKSDWIKSFSDKKLESENDLRWQVAKDGGMFDQFTGATITPRAVVNTVKATVMHFSEHKTDLFQSEKSCWTEQ